MNVEISRESLYFAKLAEVLLKSDGSGLKMQVIQLQLEVLVTQLQNPFFSSIFSDVGIKLRKIEPWYRCLVGIALGYRKSELM